MRSSSTTNITNDSEAIGTKNRILDVAERLFADHGIDGTSLRMITNEAAVNLAAVNYHFQSKDGLIIAVFERRLGPIKARQLALLQKIEQRVGYEPPALEEILRVIIEPVVIGEGSFYQGQDTFRRLIGRIFAETGSHLPELVKEQFVEVTQKFDRLVAQTLPQLSPEELFWRRHFLIGALHHVLLISNRLDAYAAEGFCPTFDARQMVERLVAFAAAGFRSQLT